MTAFAEIKAQRAVHQQELLEREEQERKAQAAAIEQKRLQREQQKRETLARAQRILENDPRYQQIKAILDPKQNQTLFEALEAVWQAWDVREKQGEFLGLRQKVILPFKPKIVLPEVTEVELVTHSKVVTEPVCKTVSRGRSYRKIPIGEREVVRIYKMDNTHTINEPISPEDRVTDMRLKRLSPDDSTALGNFGHLDFHISDYHFQDEELGESAEEALKAGGILYFIGGKHIEIDRPQPGGESSSSGSWREVLVDNRFVLIVNIDLDVGAPKFHLGRDRFFHRSIDDGSNHVYWKEKQAVHFDTQDELLVHIADRLIDYEKYVSLPPRHIYRIQREEKKRLATSGGVIIYSIRNEPEWHINYERYVPPLCEHTLPRREHYIL